MMIAAMSDIHSNVFALDAVLKHAKQQGADLLLNLGDILYGPIAPKATYDRLHAETVLSIRGNQDRQIYEATSEDLKTNPTLEFIHSDLGEEPMEWMRSLPFDRQVTPDVYACHGSPVSDLEYLLENAESGRAQLRSDDAIIDRLAGQSSNVILCGHTHTPRVVHLTNGQMVVNPGSVGMPAYTDDEPFVHSMESYSPHASYALLESGEFGWTVMLCRVPYDVAAAVQAAQAQDRSDWAHFLSTGRGMYEH